MKKNKFSLTQDIKSEEIDETNEKFIKMWYKAYCYREEVLLRKALFGLGRHREQLNNERYKLQKIKNSVGYNLVRKTFFSWVDKYQYRIHRRKILMAALTFWAKNIVSKSFRSLKVYKQIMEQNRKKYRTFWVIR